MLKFPWYFRNFLFKELITE